MEDLYKPKDHGAIQISPEHRDAVNRRRRIVVQYGLAGAFERKHTLLKKWMAQLVMFLLILIAPEVILYNDSTGLSCPVCRIF